MKKLSHVDGEGRARMVDVGGKKNQLRIARAAGWIRLSPETVAMIRSNELKKGDVLTTAQLAGIQGAKRTPDLVPLCHSLLLDKVDVDLRLTQDSVEVQSEVRCLGRTGVEMEALTAVGVALLTVYDMCKAVDKEMEIREIRLLEKVKSDVESD